MGWTQGTWISWEQLHRMLKVYPLARVRIVHRHN